MFPSHDQAGYAYTSSLIESSEFDNLFILFKNQDELGVVSGQATDEANLFSGSVAPMFIIPSVPAGAYDEEFQVNVSASVYDPGSNFSTATGYYTAPKDGNFTFDASIDFTNGSTSVAQGDTVFTAELYVDYTGSVSDTYFPMGNVAADNSTNGDTFNITGSSTVFLSKGDRATLFFDVDNQGISTATDPMDRDWETYHR